MQAGRGLNEFVVHIAEQIISVWRQRWWTNYNLYFWRFYTNSCLMFAVWRL